MASKKNKLSNDSFIEQLINDKHYQILEDGSIYTYYNGYKNKLILDTLRKVEPFTDGKGYYQIKYNGKNLYVHRIMYRKLIGKLDSELSINHKDGNTKNNNPTNLELVSHKENIDHAVRVLGSIGKLTLEDSDKIRALFISGKNTQSELSKIFKVDVSTISKVISNKSFKNVNIKEPIVAPNKIFKKFFAKLTWEQVYSIRELYSTTSMTQTELANRFNVSQTAIYRILNNRTWKEQTNVKN